MPLQQEHALKEKLIIAEEHYTLLAHRLEKSEELLSLYTSQDIEHNMKYMRQFWKQLETVERDKQLLFTTGTECTALYKSLASKMIYKDLHEEREKEKKRERKVESERVYMYM